MRYLLQEQTKPERVKQRIQFLYDCFGIWFYVEKVYEGMIYLRSMPMNYYEDYLFILGHQNAVMSHLRKVNIKEEKIVITTCAGKHDFRKLVSKDKQLFITEQVDGYAKAYDGHEYGFDCDEVYESELKFYNRRRGCSFARAIEDSFVQLQ